MSSLLSLVALPSASFAQGRRGVGRSGMAGAAPARAGAAAGRTRSSSSRGGGRGARLAQALANRREGERSQWTLNGKPIRIYTSLRGGRYADGSYGTTYFTDALAPRQHVDVMTPTGPAQLVGIRTNRPSAAPTTRGGGFTLAPAPAPIHRAGATATGGHARARGASGGFWGGPHEGGGVVFEPPGGLAAELNAFDLQSPVDRGIVRAIDEREREYRLASPDQRRFMETTGLYGAQARAERARAEARLHRADRNAELETQAAAARFERRRPAPVSSGGLRSAVAIRYLVEQVEKQGINLASYGREVHRPDDAIGSIRVRLPPATHRRSDWGHLSWKEGAVFFHSNGETYQIEPAVVRDLLRGAPRTMTRADISALSAAGMTDRGVPSLWMGEKLPRPPAARGLEGPVSFRGQYTLRKGTDYSLFWKGNTVYIRSRAVREWDQYSHETWFEADPQSVAKILVESDHARRY